MAGLRPAPVSLVPALSSRAASCLLPMRDIEDGCRVGNKAVQFAFFVGCGQCGVRGLFDSFFEVFPVLAVDG